MTVDEVQTRLDEACRTLQRMHVPGCWPSSQNRSAWPEFVKDYWERFSELVDPQARDEAAKEVDRMIAGAETRPGPPSNLAIDRFDDAMKWFKHVRDDRHRKTLWAVSMLRGKGVYNPITRVSDRTGQHRNTVRRIYRQALDDIAAAVD